MSRNLRIDAARLQHRLARMAEIGALPGGGVCRLALSDEDRAARLLLLRWMEELGLEVTLDAIGNITGTRAGSEAGPPVMLGSHLDTVATGGIFDGTLGVLAGLEVIQTLDEAGIRTRHPLAVAAFTGEEGVRFPPDMLGALVHQGAMTLEAARAIVGIDGTTVGAELDRIGQAGPAPVGTARVRAFLELHIEQGPRLEAEGIAIGAVTGVQGISWAEYTIAGTSNHAGTTPMALRHDPGFVACTLAAFVRRLAGEIPGQVGTIGRLALEPGLVNVIPHKAVMTVDLRNPDEDRLQAAEARLEAELARLCAAEGVTATRRALARFPPTPFDAALVGRIEAVAQALGLSVTRLASGAGHDAQAFAPNAPTAMIFVPSRGGISHNVTEHTDPEHVEAGANVLLHTALALAEPIEEEP